MMYNSEKNTKDECNDIQEQIQDLYDKKNRVEDFPAIIEHLNKCEDCRIFHKSMISLEYHFQNPPHSGLKADARIRKNILNYFEIKNQIRSERSTKILEWIKSIFTVRIPVYQALSGFAVVILLFMFLTGANNTRGFWWMEIDYSGKTETYENTNLYVLDTLHLLDTSNGRNAMEDSILVGFLESSL